METDLSHRWGSYPSKDFAAFYSSGMRDRALLTGPYPDDGWAWRAPEAAKKHWLIGLCCERLWEGGEAARRTGMRRVVFASTIQVVDGYPVEEFVTTDMPPRPKNLCAVTKVYGEALGRYYAEVHGLSVICVRIGAFRVRWSVGEDENYRWCLFSARDVAQFFAKALEAKDIGYAVLFGISDDPIEHMDIEPARFLLGYEPQDSPDRQPSGTG